MSYQNGEIIIEGEYETPTGSEITFDPQNPSNITTSPVWLTSVVFYDKYGRTIQSQSNNSLGGKDVSWSEYDFSGKVLKTKSIHQTSIQTVTIRKSFEYAMPEGS